MLTSNFIILPLMEVSMKSGEDQGYSGALSQDGAPLTYMRFPLSPGVDRPLAVQALIEFAFQDLRCVHLEMMDRNLTLSDLGGLGVRHRVYRGFEIDLTGNEDELF